jgi:fused signal recognition particle receptor
MFRFFKKFSKKISDSAGGIFHVLSRTPVNEDLLGEVENILIAADFGADVSGAIVGEVRRLLAGKRELQLEDVVAVASSVVQSELAGAEASPPMDGRRPQVICLLGPNGTGKTTTAAKVAFFYKNLGKSVLLGSCDTFRAAANEQLSEWGRRLSVDVVTSHHGADPAAVAFDAHRAAIARGSDVLILDTAGRLHVKVNLMAELQKIMRSLKKADDGCTPHLWLVADGTLGSNTAEAAAMFHGAVGLTGMVVTKLDGTSAGGTLVGVCKKLKLPVYFIGVGETPDALRVFSARDYADGIFRGRMRRGGG